MGDGVVLWRQFTHTIDVHVMMMKTEGRAPQSWFPAYPRLHYLTHGIQFMRRDFEWQGKGHPVKYCRCEWISER